MLAIIGITCKLTALFYPILLINDIRNRFTRYGGLARGRDPLLPIDVDDHVKRMLRRSPVSDLQEANA